MTEAQDRLHVAIAAFDLAHKRVDDHIGRAVVAGPAESAPPTPPLDEEWGAELEDLERELNEALAALMAVAREVSREWAAHSASQ